MNRLNSWLRLGTAVVCFMPLGEGGGDGGQRDGGGAGDGGQGAGAGDGGAGGWKEPDGLPEQFRGAKSSDELLGKLLPAYQGARETISKFPAAPKNVADYVFTPTDKTKPYFPEGRDDPFMGLAREVALKNGIPVAGFSGFVNGIYEAALDKGLLAAPFSEASEIKSFNTALGLDDKAGAQALKDTLAFTEGLLGQLQVPETVKEQVGEALMALTDTAAGNIALRALQQRLAGGGIRIGGSSSIQGVLTAADLKTLSGDPRIDPINADSKDPAVRYDPELRRRYDEGYKAIYGKGGRDD